MLRSCTTFSHPRSLSSTSNSRETYSPLLLVRLIATDSPVCGSIASNTYPIRLKFFKQANINNKLDHISYQWVAFSAIIPPIEQHYIRRLTEATGAHQLLGLDVKVPRIAAILWQFIELILNVCVRGSSAIISHHILLLLLFHFILLLLLLLHSSRASLRMLLPWLARRCDLLLLELLLLLLLHEHLLLGCSVPCVRHLVLLRLVETLVHICRVRCLLVLLIGYGAASWGLLGLRGLLMMH